MHRNKEDFFEQMDNYKTSYSKFEILCCGITITSLIIDYILLILIACEVLQFNVITTPIIVLSFLFVLSFIYLLISLFSKNKILFIAGKLSAGIKNFAIIVIPLYIMLLIFYFAIPQWREFLPSIFTISTTMAVAILTIMGVHYNIAKQQIEKNDRKNLIFALSEEETANNFNIGIH